MTTWEYVEEKDPDTGDVSYAQVIDMNTGKYVYKKIEKRIEFEKTVPFINGRWNYKS
jgi:hypothetical protein